MLVAIDTKTPDPKMALMHKDLAPRFNKLRKDVYAASGVDFLAKCGDVLRPPGFKSAKDGVANRSWHKTGRAVDIDQTSPALVIQSDVIGGKQYFRTFLRCQPQDGSKGRRLVIRDMRGYTVSAFLVDFTAMAEAAGFTRIPAWKGWQSNYNRREWWHYQDTDGLTWDAAMLQLKGKARPEPEKVLGVNDRGDAVEELQRKLVELAWLAPDEIDGIFGPATKAGVVAFQEKSGLAADGLVGPNTRKALGL